MAVGPPVLTVGQSISTISISRNLYINCALCRRRRTYLLQVDGNCRMILQSTRMATSQTVLDGGIFQACISLARTAGAAQTTDFKEWNSARQYDAVTTQAEEGEV